MRSVFFNVFQSVIVLLYVLDNETNFVIKVSCFVGLGIEVWKITKVSGDSWRGGGKQEGRECPFALHITCRLGGYNNDDNNNRRFI